MTFVFCGLRHVEKHCSRLNFKGDAEVIFRQIDVAWLQIRSSAALSAPKLKADDSGFLTLYEAGTGRPGRRNLIRPVMQNNQWISGDFKGNLDVTTESPQRVWMSGVCRKVLTSPL